MRSTRNADSNNNNENNQLAEGEEERDVEIIPPLYETCFKRQEIMANNDFIRIQMLERGFKSGKNIISDSTSEKNIANEDNIEIQFFVGNTYIIDPRCSIMKIWKAFNSIMIVYRYYIYYYV